MLRCSRPERRVGPRSSTTIDPLTESLMSKYYIRETFFRLPEHTRECSTLPAAVYNDLQLLLKRSDRKSLFLPIRSMQFQAVVEPGEVIFVDSQGGYAHQNGTGGRLICISWQPIPAVGRASLNGPVACEIVSYFADFKETQRRLMSEFPPVLRRLLQRQCEKDLQVMAPRVLPLRRDPRAGCPDDLTPSLPSI